MRHAGCNDCHYQPHLEEGSHSFGQPDTATCHGSHAQIGKSQWSYFEKTDVKKLFKGSYAAADKNGIRFSSVIWENPDLAANRKLEDIAPFAVLPMSA